MSGVMARVLWVLVVGWSTVGLAEGPPMVVTAKRLGAHRVRIQGSVTVPQTPEAVWQVLTDYDHLSEFIPDLRESRTIALQPTRLLRQQGNSRWWIFSRRVRVTFQVEETPRKEIRFRAVDGDFLEHQGVWRLMREGDRTRIVYDAVVQPRFFIPTLIGARLLKAHLAASLQAIADRSEAVSATTP